MGCDIHLFVERLQDGKWTSCDDWTSEDGYWTTKTDFYGGRNYDLFAILADVRNGRGFAGTKTGEGFIPMAAPRGVPADASPEYQRMVEQWFGDGHSHSFFTVADIQVYDWTQTTTKSGWVTLQEWARWKVNESPDNWCSMIAGKSIKHFSLSQIQNVVDELKTDIWQIYHGDKPTLEVLSEALGGKPDDIYVLVDWEIPYYRAGHTFLSETLPRLWRLGKPEEVRVVFFFDN